jgi:hypothetical protein
MPALENMIIIDDIRNHQSPVPDRKKLISITIEPNAASTVSAPKNNANPRRSSVIVITFRKIPG